MCIVVRQKPQGPKSASHRINPEKIMGGRPLFAPAFVFPTGDQSCCSVSSAPQSPANIFIFFSTVIFWPAPKPYVLCSPPKRSTGWRLFSSSSALNPYLRGDSSLPARSVDFVQFDERPGAAGAAHKYFSWSIGISLSQNISTRNNRAFV